MKKTAKLILALITLTAISGADTNAKQLKSLINKNKQNSSVQYINKNANAVQDMIEIVQKATPEEKTAVLKEANIAVERLLAELHERTYLGDLRGYTEEQIIAAGDKIELLEVEAQHLRKKIDILKLEIDGMTDKGWFWNSAKEGKKEEREIAKAELNSLNVQLNKIKKAINNQTIIAGKAYATAIKIGVAIVTMAATAGVAAAIDAYTFDGKGRAYISEKASNLYETLQHGYSQLPELPFMSKNTKNEKQITRPTKSDILINQAKVKAEKFANKAHLLAKHAEIAAHQLTSQAKMKAKDLAGQAGIKATELIDQSVIRAQALAEQAQQLAHEATIKARQLADQAGIKINTLTEQATIKGLNLAKQAKIKAIERAKQAELEMQKKYVQIEKELKGKPFVIVEPKNYEQDVPY
jgi:hypothetical protein